MTIPRTTMIDDDGSGTTGTILNNAWKQELYGQIDQFVSNGGTWTLYTPTWAGGGGGTGPALGNGSITGRFFQVGRMCHVAITLVLGSTSTAGTSPYYRLTLPLSLLMSGTVQGNAMTALAMNPGGSIYGGFVATGDTTSSVYAVNTAGALWNPTTPFAWVAGSLFAVRGTFEVA